MTTIAALLLVPTVLAQEGEKKKGPDFTPEGLLYAQYGYDLTDTGSDATNGYNAFDLTRAYFGARIERGDHFAVRFVFDAGRGADAARQWAFLKYGYAEAKGLVKGVTFQGGMIPLPYIVWFDSFWGNRYISKAFPDQYQLLAASDFGVGAVGEHAKGKVSWHAVAVNGESFAKPEADQTKTVQARFTVDPLAGGEKNNLPITGFVAYAAPPVDGDATLTWIANTGFRMPYLLVHGEVLGRTTGDVSGLGFAGTLMPRVPDVGYLVVRYDHFDPDGDVADDAADRVVAGVGHDFMKKVSLAVTYERAWAEVAPDAPTHGVFLKGQAGF